MHLAPLQLQRFVGQVLLERNLAHGTGHLNLGAAIFL
jgi:hypothetical protein